MGRVRRGEGSPGTDWLSSLKKTRPPTYRPQSSPCIVLATSLPLFCPAGAISICCECGTAVAVTYQPSLLYAPPALELSGLATLPHAV